MARRTVTTDVQEDDEPSYPDHPLFPLEEGDKSIDVSYIQITRFEAGVQKYGPTIPASDLLTEQDIENRYGGGEYILIARAASKIDGVPGRFRRHRRINLPGKPKPLSANPTQAEEKLSGIDTGSAGQPSGTVSAGGDMMPFMTMMLQMQQQSLERERQASERFMTMFLGMMNGSKGDSQNMMNMMMTMSAQQQQSMLQFITATMSNRGGGPEEMAKYADLLRTLGVGGAAPAKENKEEGAGIGKMLEDAADLVQGIVQLKNSGIPPTATPASEAAPPTTLGGAMSLLRR